MKLTLLICLSALLSLTLCEGGCGDGRENHLGLCYDPCEAGYHRVLCTCASDDDPIFTTYPAGCGTIPGGRKLSNQQMAQLRKLQKLIRELSWWDSMTDWVGDAWDATSDWVEDAWDATSDWVEDLFDRRKLQILKEKYN